MQCWSLGKRYWKGSKLASTSAMDSNQPSIHLTLVSIWEGRILVLVGCQFRETNMPVFYHNSVASTTAALMNKSKAHLALWSP